MLIGYARVSKADGSQLLDLQRDALIEAGVDACMKALQPGNTFVIWKLDCLGRDLKHLVATVDALRDRGVGLRVLAGAGAEIDTTTANGRLVFERLPGQVGLRCGRWRSNFSIFPAPAWRS